MLFVIFICWLIMFILPTFLVADFWVPFTRGLPGPDLAQSCRKILF